MIKLLAVYAAVAVIAPVAATLAVHGAALLVGRRDAWYGPAYIIVSGPPQGARGSSVLLHGAASALKAALAALVGVALALLLTVRPAWPVVVCAFLPTTVWRLIAFRSGAVSVEMALGSHVSEADRLEAHRLRRRHDTAEIAGYVAGALAAGVLLVR